MMIPELLNVLTYRQHPPNSRPVRAAAHFLLRLVSSAGAWANTSDFRSVEQFCLFVGHGRSGHSLIGALLDAHPEMVIAHEFHTLQHLRPELSEKELYFLLLSRSQWFARRNAQWNAKGEVYKYAVPSQYKGTHTSLRVVGDKKGGGTSRILLRNPELLSVLKERLSVPVNLIHVTRHPLDNISTLTRKDRDGKIEQGIDLYFRLCEGVRLAREQTPDERWLTLPLEEFIQDPETGLVRTCNFLGVETTDDYLRDCSEIVFDTPNRSRKKVSFKPGHIDQIQHAAADFSFLNRYDLRATGKV